MLALVALLKYVFDPDLTCGFEGTLAALLEIQDSLFYTI